MDVTRTMRRAGTTIDEAFEKSRKSTPERLFSSGASFPAAARGIREYPSVATLPRP